MPSVLENFSRECQKAAEEKYVFFSYCFVFDVPSKYQSSAEVDIVLEINICLHT